MKKLRIISLCIPALLVIILLTSCTTSHQISLERGKLFVPPNTEIYKLLLKNGDSVTFGEDYGRFFQSTDSNGAKQGFIAGYDLNHVWVKIPAENIALVQGENSKTEVWKSRVIGYSGVLLSLPVAILLFGMIVGLKF